MGHAQKITAVEAGEKDAKTPLLDRIIFWKRDLPVILGVSIRTIDRWISTQDFPQADVTISGKPVWRRETIQSWSGKRG